MTLKVVDNVEPLFIGGNPHVHTLYERIEKVIEDHIALKENANTTVAEVIGTLEILKAALIVRQIDNA